MSTVHLSRHAGGTSLPRHQHADGYAALLLTGGYVEAGDRGRHRVEAGQVLIHGDFEAHQDDFAPSGAVVLNLSVSMPLDHHSGIVKDPDAIARLAERDQRGAAELLMRTFQPLDSQLGDWPDRLASALRDSQDLRISEWAEHMNLAPQSVSRGFRLAFGISPKRYRARQRALRALRALSLWEGKLADLAAEMGFTDQAHFTRALTAVTGHSPHLFRVQSVQDAA